MLGEAGLSGATRLLGLAGYAFPPFVALAGLLVLLGCLPLVRTVGAALILLAVATTLAALLLSPEQRFEPAAYTEAGGILGSGLYAAVHSAVGAIGAILAVLSLYAVGFSLLTSVSLGAAAQVLGYGAYSLHSSLTSWARQLRESRERGRREMGGPPSREAVAPAPQEIDVTVEKPPPEEPPAILPEGAAVGDEAAFEVVLPQRRDPVADRCELAPDLVVGRDENVRPGRAQDAGDMMLFQERVDRRGDTASLCGIGADQPLWNHRQHDRHRRRLPGREVRKQIRATGDRGGDIAIAEDARLD